jgi:hypothetical protein
MKLNGPYYIEPGMFNASNIKGTQASAVPTFDFRQRVQLRIFKELLRPSRLQGGRSFGLYAFEFSLGRHWPALPFLGIAVTPGFASGPIHPKLSTRFFKLSCIHPLNDQ